MPKEERVMGRKLNKMGSQHQAHQKRVSALGSWLPSPRSELLNPYGHGPFLIHQLLVELSVFINLSWLHVHWTGFWKLLIIRLLYLKGPSYLMIEP